MPGRLCYSPARMARFRGWLAKAGTAVVLLLAVGFVLGLVRRERLEARGEQMIRMLFVPSVEQGTLVRRGDELARFIRADSGLVLRSQVPTSYAAVIQALGSDQADVAWIPAFGYVLAHARHGAEARLQVVRSVERYAIVVTRDGPGQPDDLAGLAGATVAVPATVVGELRETVAARLDAVAPGWRAIPAESDEDAVRRVVEREADAAVSRWVYSGTHDLVGDGRKLLEYHRPGTLRETRVLATTERPVIELSKVYYGCVLSRADSGVHRLEDLEGRAFAFSDETSTSGHVFPRVLLQSAGVSLGHVLFAGGHPNVVQAVRDGKVDGGATFYSPPSAANAADGTLVGDARFLLLKNMPTREERRELLEEVRVLALTAPIPNDVCCVRRGFPPALWDRFERSLQRFLETEEGRSAYYDLVAGVAAAPTTDAAFDGFREALAGSGVSAARLLEAEEQKLQRKRGG